MRVGEAGQRGAGVGDSSRGVGALCGRRDVERGSPASARPARSSEGCGGFSAEVPAGEEPRLALPCSDPTDSRSCLLVAVRRARLIGQEKCMGRRLSLARCSEDA